MQRRMRTSLVQLHCFCLREEKELLRVRPIGHGFACSRSLHGARRLTSRQSQRGGWARDFDRGFSAQPSLVVRPAWLILVVGQNFACVIHPEFLPCLPRYITSGSAIRTYGWLS